jgi:hypothetical protein
VAIGRRYRPERVAAGPDRRGSARRVPQDSPVNLHHGRGKSDDGGTNMPQCRLPSGEVISVGSCAECDKQYNGGCFSDSTPGTIQFNIPCFVRNVLIRTLADALLDVGSTDTISVTAVEALAMSGERPDKQSGEAALRPLTPALREELAREITGGIMQLAATYRTTVDFRDHVLLPSPRGRELKEHYDRQLAEIYHVAARDLHLVHDAAATWLAVHPFVAAMVDLARDGGTIEAAGPVLSAEQYRRCTALFRRFRQGSDDAAFREVLTEIEREFEGYEGLTAQDALEKLRAAGRGKS